MRLAKRLVFLFLSMSSCASGLGLAALHPVSPALAIAGFLLFLAVSVWRPDHGLFLLPVFLPVLDFSPWTGWVVVAEYDLAVLAVVTGGCFVIFQRNIVFRQWRVFFLFLVVACLLIGRGAMAGPMNSFFDSLTSLNSLRVGKSLLWVALLFPVVAIAKNTILQNEPAPCLFAAFVLGSAWVVAGVIWERAFYPGLLDIFTPYRTVGLFWEMHHGGAALDAYLVLIAPLLAWAWRTTISPVGRALLALFIVAFAYACLTTFSRGVAFAIGGAMLLYCILFGWQARRSASSYGRIRPSSVLVLLALAVEIILVFGTDSFMNHRLQDTRRDFGGRLEHWERGLRQLERPTDWLFGVGLGKLPSRWTQGDNALALPGRFEMAEQADGTHGLRLFGPDRREITEDFGRLFALSQRIALNSSALHRFSMMARSERRARVLVQICASHLLYPAQCNDGVVIVEPSGWQPIQLDLIGALIDGITWQKAGHGVFLLSVLTPGTMVEIRDAHVADDGPNLLRNPQFKKQQGQWFAQSFSYFLPWHIDNLYLELLVETGIVGLLAFLAVAFRSMWEFFQSYLHGETFPIELLSCLSGLFALGLVVSVLDMPRVAMLAGLLMVWGAQFLRVRPA